MANRFHADAAGLLNFLWSQFDLKSAPTEEIEHLARASEEAANLANSLADLTIGLGCLINEDRDSNAAAKCGALQGDSQVPLLFTIGTKLDVISKMARIGSDAEYELRKRLSSQLEKRASRRMHSAEQSSTPMEGA